MVIMISVAISIIAAWIGLNGGWEMVLLFPPWLVVLIAHVCLHGKYAQRIEQWKTVSVFTFVCSDLLLLGVFLAQVGEGDELASVYITSVMHLGQYVPDWYSFQLGLSTIVLVFLSWICVWMVSRPRYNWHLPVMINVVGCILVFVLLFNVVQGAKQKREGKTISEVALMEALDVLPPRFCFLQPKNQIEIMKQGQRHPNPNSPSMAD